MADSASRTSEEPDAPQATPQPVESVGVGTEAWFRSIFEHAPIGISLVRRDAHVERCNPALERVLGYREAELRKMSFAEFTHPEDLGENWMLFQQLWRGERERYRLDKRYIRGDGRIVWARVTVSLLAGPTEDATRAISMVEDISADRAAQHEREQLLHELAERVKENTALHAVTRILQDDQLDAQQLFERIVVLLPKAFQRPELTAATVRCGSFSASTPGYREAHRRLTAPIRTRAGGSGSVDVVYLGDSPDKPFIDEERRLVESVAEMIETTLDRRLAEQALQRSEQRLTMALSAAGMAVWEWDPATSRVTWSEEIERLAGLEPGTFPGTYAAFINLVHEDDRPTIEAAIHRALAVPDPGDDVPGPSDAFEVDVRMVRPDGEVRWLTSKASVLRNAMGEPVGMLGVVHDITERRNLEQQFRRAQRMEAMGRLAGGIAHDFNNLLTVIQGYSELLVKALDPDDARRLDAEEVSSAARRAADLTRQLLAFSRQQMLEPRIVRPNEIIADLEKLLARLIGASIELRVTLAPDTGAVRVDPTQLEQVLMNLVVNARDAMPAGGVLTVSTAVTDVAERTPTGADVIQPGRYVLLSVSDTGIGMTADVKGRIFEPFYTTKEQGHGTGLGLATVYGIVRQSGGVIGVRTEPGAGSVFEVYLPQISDESTAPAAPRGTPSQGGTETVLVVDDDAAVRAFAERVLRAGGYRVMPVGTAREALDLAEHDPGPIDLVVTDIVMPDMQGPELAARLQVVRPSTRVLLITGYTERPFDPDAAPNVGGVLQKPFGPGALLRTVREILGAARPN